MSKKLSQTKNAKAKRAAKVAKQTAQLALVKAQVATGEVEANVATIKRDDILAASQAGDEKAIALVSTMETIAPRAIEDELTCTEASNAWNRNAKNILPVI